MKVSLSWLQRYVPLTVSIEELATRLPLLGLEVDEVIQQGLPPLQKVVVGQILSVDKHPQADRLTVCRVEVGETTPYQIVCGAKNHKPGDYVPVALPGSRLPNGVKIKKGKFRGEESSGMLCSEQDLGLSDASEGLLVFAENNKPAVGTPINEVITDSNVVLSLEVTPNRGDCLGHLGVARELAAYYQQPCQTPTVRCAEAWASQPTAESLLRAVQVETDQCPLYTAWSIRGIKIAPSPAWLKRDIEAIGLRSVNNIVDITNWVMMELGQPLHAFDVAKIAGATLTIRQAQADEKIITLDNRERILDPSMMVIADADKPLVVAGIMGSLAAEVDDHTTDIVLESAYFQPTSIRATARTLGLSTDSSYRFERDVDPTQVDTAARRAIDMILDIAGGELVGPAVAVGELPQRNRIITVTPDYIRSVCGFTIADDTIVSILERLGFSVDRATASWSVTVPTYRADMLRPIDLVEEFIRLYGPERIPEEPVTATGVEREDDPEASFKRRVADYLVGQHANECYHYSLRSAAELTRWYPEQDRQALGLANPLTSDQSHLRSSLIPGLLDAMQLNLAHGNDVRRLFECGHVFHAHNSQIEEYLSVAFLLLLEPTTCTWQPVPAIDFYRAKQIALELVHIAGISPSLATMVPVADQPTWQPDHAAEAGSLAKYGYLLQLGMIHLKMLKAWAIKTPIIAAELRLRLDKLQQPPVVKYRPFSSYPPVMKDLALVVDESVLAGDVLQDLAQIGMDAVQGNFLLEDVTVFDVYTGQGMPKGKKSVAFNLKFRADSRTLTDKEVGAVFSRIQAAIQQDRRYQVRT